MQMARRLFAVRLAAGFLCFAQDQDQVHPQPGEAPRPGTGSNDRLPNGKSRSNAVAEEEHQKALDEADQLVKMSQDLRQQIAAAGKFVVPVQAVKKTEDIEKLARKIRGRLKG